MSDLTWLDRQRLTARWDAALELIRARDDLRELAKLGRSTDEDKWRHDEASKAWDRANNRPAAREELGRLIAAKAKGGTR